MGARRTCLTALAAVGILFVAAGVGFADKQTVNDPADDGPGPEGEILRATAGHAKNGLLVHTVTIEGTLPSVKDAGYLQVDINDRRRGPHELTLSSAIPPAQASLKNEHTIVLKVRQRAIKREGDFGRRYFWSSGACCYPNFSTDYAPDKPDGHGGTSAPQYKAHSFKR
jgi:hypothetical protein